MAYLDYEQQEFGIAAALSGDSAMAAAYASGDPYLGFAKQAGAVPGNATKKTHKAVRDQFKECALGVQYGMEAKTLATRLNVSERRARELLELHRRTYPQFWRWSQSAVDHAMLLGFLTTVFGWRILVGPDARPTALRNFPMQANGAEMLRIACCLMTGRGVEVCAPVHDAVVIEAASADIEEAIAIAGRSMVQASEIVLGGFQIRTEAQPIVFPGHFVDPRGDVMWRHVSALLREFGAGAVL